MSASSTTFPTDSTAPTPISYIWIGPPTTDAKGKAIEPSSHIKSSVPGHDITGPILMATLNKTNPLFFWCLNEFLEHYQTVFSPYPHVKVGPIETYLLTPFSSEKVVNLATEASRLIGNLLGSSTVSIRDRVTVKNIFSLFILMSKGGYILDTNILPVDENKAIALAPRTKMLAPSFKEKPLTTHDLDFWLLYSPPQLDAAMDLFNDFLKNFENTNTILKNEGKDSFAYYTSLAPAVLKSLLKQYELGNMDLLFIKQQNAYVNMNELGLRKIYSNTHTFAERKRYDPTLYAVTPDTPSELMVAADNGNVLWMKLLIQHGANVNERIKKSTQSGLYEGETAAHFAIRSNQIGALKILIANGADLNIPAYYNNKSLTALQLMEKMPEFQEILTTIKAPSLKK